MKNRILVPALVLTIMGGTLFAAQSAQAQTTAQGFGMDSIVQKLAQKFNLNEADVKAVFEEEHQQMQQQMHAKMDERLTQAVSEGKITEEQKQKISAKQTEMRAEREAQIASGKGPQGQSKTEFKAQHQQQRAELEQWATDNNVPLEYLMPKMFVKHMIR